MPIDSKTKGKVDAIITGAFKGKIKSFDQLKSTLSNDIQAGLRENEYLDAIKNQIARIATVNFIKLDVPILKHFWDNSLGSVGDYLLERQVMLGRASDWSPWLDVNDHHNPEVKEQIMKTVYKKRFDLSISAEIVAGAFRGYGEMNDFITQYMSSIEKAVTLYWNNEQLKMFQSIPTVYKMTSDGSNGVETSKEIWQILAKMKMVSNQFSYEGIPQYSTPEELILVLNSKYMKGIQFDGVGGVFNFGNISNSGTIKNIYVYDFPNKETIGVILTPQSFKLDKRIAESTKQKWAKTLIEDNYYHMWVRAMRGNFSNTVRLVAPDAKLGDKVLNSPFTHYEDERKKTLIKDEPVIKDITAFVNSDTLPLIEPPTNLMSLLPRGTFAFVGAGDAPTSDEIKAALGELDVRLDTNNIDVSDITTTSATITAKGFYVVN